jgi:hypothetical protein
MTIPTSRERVDYAGGEGSRLQGNARQVISGLGASRTLLASESGAAVLFDRAAGIVITLPAITSDDIGMYFDFFVTVTGTGSYSIDTDAATTFIGGGIYGGSTTAGGGDAFPGDIAASVSIDLDDTTTGEDVGGWVRVTATSTTTWVAQGLTFGSGLLATPFA